MQSDLSIAILAGLGGMLGWGFADFFAKKTIDTIGDLTSLFWGQLIGIVPLLLIFLYHPTVPTLNHWDPLWLILFGIVSALSYLVLYNGFGKGEVSLLSPIFASYSAVAVILAALLFNEAVPQSQQIAIVIVFAGLLLISSDPREIRQILKVKTNRVKGVPEVLSAMLVYALWLVLLDHFISGKDWVFFLLVIRSVSALTLFIYAMLKKVSLKVTQKGVYKYLVGIGVFDVAAFSFVSWGFSHSSYTAVVAVLSSTFSIPTIILARTFLKEKITPLQAWAIVTILIGVSVIAVH